jgi:hypothetical protein
MTRGQSLPPPPAPDAGSLRAHILATEHWSLLATRSMTWTEVFSRTGTFLTVVSATVVALSFVAQGLGFDGELQGLALVILPVVLLLGIATFLRLVEADVEDAWLVLGMNRIRHAYLELDPDLEPYFITSAHDDTPGMLRTYAFRERVGVWHWLSGSPLIVALIDAVITGALAALIARTANADAPAQITVGLLAGGITGAALVALGIRRAITLSRDYTPRFPTSDPSRGSRLGRRQPSDTKVDR